MRKWLTRTAIAAAVLIGLPTIALAYAEFQALSSIPGISCAAGNCSLGATVMMWANGSGQVGSGPYGYVPLGFCQLSVTTSSAQGLSACSGGIPAGAKLAQYTVETNTIRVRDDGIAPTPTVGFPVQPGTILPYSGALSAIQFLAIAGSANVDVNFYK